MATKHITSLDIDYNVSQNKDFGSKSRRSHVSTRRRPQEVPSGCILKYVEDLKRGPNTEIGPKDYFEIGDNICVDKVIHVHADISL